MIINQIVFFFLPLCVLVVSMFLLAISTFFFIYVSDIVSTPSPNLLLSVDFFSRFIAVYCFKGFIKIIPISLNNFSEVFVDVNLLSDSFNVKF
jgi:hypothetical protein